MFKNAVAILDIRSSKITALIGERSVNTNYPIRAICEKPHEGYCLDGFLDKRSTRNAIYESIEYILRIANVSLSEIYISVPDVFTLVRNASSKYVLNRKRKIVEKDIDNYFDIPLNSVQANGYTVIDRSWVNCFIDGNNRVYSPFKQVSTAISGYNSYYLASNEFMDFIKECISPFKIKSVVFVPSVIARSKFLFSREERYSYEILLDVGYISSSLSIIFGDGILFHRPFEIGDGYIGAYLSKRLNIDYGVAMLLTKKINLSLNSNDGNYDVFYVDKGYSFNIDSVNEICKDFLCVFGEEIDKAIFESRVRLPNKNICISLTGGGISSIRGAMEYLSSVLDIRVNLVVPSVPCRNKPEESSKFSLLSYALNHKNKYRNI